jgi:hypothetical protein
MKMVPEIMLNDHPHSSRLPQEREKRTQFFCVARQSCFASAPGYEKKDSGNSLIAFGMIQVPRRLFPLLGGEGQGEGGRYN